ncbi:N-methyl-L-tryptophan oxidase [Cohnella kolymensis]|uniref:N-methyl-L-tryptophan oxidase n=1 Tax=Cohnella kolymensis TaxID=1590652 RepID=UPI000697FC5B|nr:N-methyl-L-tryptophan oxidase [Cohnella kolymensis]
MEHYDVIVVGAGSMGMSSGYHLAAKGLRTLLIDANDPPHTSGSHHGETRIIRHAYGEGREYTPMALRAQKLWRDLEKETDRKLFIPTGFLQAGEPGSAMLTEMMDSAAEHNVPMEILVIEEIRRRWPALALPDSAIGCYERDSGVLLCEECIAAYRYAALARGAELKVNTRVTAIEPDPEGVIVTTADGASYRAEAAIVTAGKFAGPMLQSVGLAPPLQPIRKTVAWFPDENGQYDAGRFPAFLFDLPEGIYYGFPSIEGSGVKAGRHDGEHRPAPTEGPLPPFGSYADDGEDVAAYVQRYMPGVSPKAQKGSTCTYTMTPDEHFILDRHPDYSHILLGAGFSGHGFKFASVIGEILSQLAANESPGFDISLFSLDRFGTVPRKADDKDGTRNIF